MRKGKAAQKKQYKNLVYLTNTKEAHFLDARFAQRYGAERWFPNMDKVSQ